jgi:hypothetical protein
MTLRNKNTIPTSFTIDLSTIDRKIDKLVKYFHNSDIDLKRAGLDFLMPNATYKSLKKSLDNRKYKESLALKVDEIYFQRFILTALNLTLKGVAEPLDFLIPGAFDDFGSRFDAFCATNTNPNNIILQLLNIKPYKYLKVDLLTKQELEIYSKNTEAAYEYDRLVFLSQKLSSLTSQFLALDNENAANFITRINEDIFTIRVVKFPEKNTTETLDLATVSQEATQATPTGDIPPEPEAPVQEVTPELPAITVEDREVEGSWNETKKIWKTRVYNLKEYTNLQELKDAALLTAGDYVEGISRPPKNKDIKNTIKDPKDPNLIQFEIKGKSLIALPERPIVKPPEPPPPTPFMTDEEFNDLLKPQPKPSEISSDLVDIYPDLQKARDLFESFSSPTYRFITEAALSELREVDEDMYSTLVAFPLKEFASQQYEKAKIKILSNIIKKVFDKNLEANQYKIENLINFGSSYLEYDFFEQQFKQNQNFELDLPDQQPAKKEELIFKLTFLREEVETITRQVADSKSPLKLEFPITQQLSVLNAFNNSGIRNNKFIAIVDGYDLSLGSPVEFFEPTVLSILSDIDYIDSNLTELDLTYCPPPESMTVGTKERIEERKRLEVVEDVLSLQKNTTIEVNNQIYNFKEFPDLYFIPNLYPQAAKPTRVDSFYKIIDQNLTRAELDELIKKYSRFYYTTQNDTPSAQLARDRIMAKKMTDVLSRNSFYGLYEMKKNSFANWNYIKQIIDNLKALDKNAGIKLESIIFAKTNIFCLLKEFQACFLPQIPSCKDVLRGFRFADLQNLVSKLFPESLYPVLWQGIKKLSSDLIKNEREKELIAEIEELEAKIKNSKKKKIVFDKLDKNIAPDLALTQADIEIGIDKKNINLKKAYKNKLKEYKEFKLSNEIIETQSLTESQIAEDADKFLQLLEDNGLPIDMLCDLARLLFDLSGISFTFGKLALPQLPEFDLFHEVKMNLDLSIIQIILDAVVQFILKLLEELLSCGGLKNLIEAGLTGNTEGMGLLATTVGALNQMALGNFDLNEFVDKNPQIDPREFKKDVENTLKMLTGSLSVDTTARLDVTAELGPIGIELGAELRDNSSLASNGLQTKGDSKEKKDILRNSSPTPETEQEFYSSFTQLVTSLSDVLGKVEFVNLVGGSPSEEALVATSYYIRKEKPELQFISEPAVLRNIFSYIAKTSGLEEMKTELEAVATAYNVKSRALSSVNGLSYCVDPRATTPPVISGSGTVPNIKNFLDPSAGKTPEEVYGGIIKDLLAISPENLKSLIDDKVFKPILLGKLPNGNKIKEVDESQKRTIKRAFEPISDKFKESANGFYSNLPMMKKVTRTIPKYIKQKNEDGEEIELDNPEFKDKVNQGTGIKDAADGESITVEENKHVYGALFKDPFIESSNTFNINTRPQKLKLSISGKRGHTSPDISRLMSTYLGELYDTWTVTSEQTEDKRVIKLVENGGLGIGENEVFSYSISGSNTEQISEANNLNSKYISMIKDNLSNSIIKNEDYENYINVYLKDSYDKFLSFVYKSITTKISDDALLKEIDLSLLDTNTPTMNLLMPLLNLPVSIPLGYNENPNIDSPLKYINFSPKQTDQQKSKDMDPSLFGLKEITKLVVGLMDKRNNELSENFSDLEKLIEDKDSALDSSLIDGLYMSLIRSACSELCLRSLFVLRTFKYDKTLLNDLLLPTFVSDTIYKELTFFSKQKVKESIMIETKKHINYLHDYVFENPKSKEDLTFLLQEVEDLKDMREALLDDQQIILSYKYDFKRNIKDDLEEKIDNLVQCLKDEIEKHEIKILKLQLRNLAYNELMVIFDKLSCITSTNPKTLDSLPSKCQQQEGEEGNNFLRNFLPDSLIESNLYDPVSIHVSKGNPGLENAKRLKQAAIYRNNNIFLEHYAYVGEINKTKYRAAWEKQKEFNLYGVQGIRTLINFLGLDEVKNSIPNNKNISDLFSVLEYGMRMVWIVDNEPNIRSSVIYEDDKSTYENFQNIVNSQKNKFYFSENNSSQIKNVRFAGKSMPINLLEKTYSVPIVFEKQNQKWYGLMNIIPILKEQTKIDLSSYNLDDLISDLSDIEDKKGNTFIQTKTKLVCSEKLKEFYDILSSNNLLSNLMILSSVGVLSNQQIRSSFTSVRGLILNDILINFNKNNFDDILADLLDMDVFKNFNAMSIIKVTLRAAVYVLQYYCQMTDPNINIALMYRNAVKLFLNIVSQVAGPFVPVPAEIPPPLNALAIYSMGQLPINVFGIPPAGIGIGPPITIPGMVLLAVEIILLASEISINFDANDGDDQIKELLKKYCINIHGYKKYGVE